jgi:hypothetical protein
VRNTTTTFGHVPKFHKVLLQQHTLAAPAIHTAAMHMRWKDPSVLLPDNCPDPMPDEKMDFEQSQAR